MDTVESRRAETAISVNGRIADIWGGNLGIRAIEESECAPDKERERKHILAFYPVDSLGNMPLNCFLKAFFV